ncbi:hypothetical protein GQ600_11261 [Phytophthora cactorum]|nr:hypothetical protein GQ600_11261 [Phytophthora cactorum]
MLISVFDNTTLLPKCLGLVNTKSLTTAYCAAKKSKSSYDKVKTFWIWESMPTDMDLALEKLLPAIKKYMRVLGQFFLRQAVQSSSTTTNRETIE